MKEELKKIPRREFMSQISAVFFGGGLGMAATAEYFREKAVDRVNDDLRNDLEALDLLCAHRSISLSDKEVCQSTIESIKQDIVLAKSPFLWRYFLGDAAETLVSTGLVISAVGGTMKVLDAIYNRKIKLLGKQNISNL